MTKPQPPRIEVPYRSPEERAKARLKSYALGDGLSWVLVLCGILTAFLTAGQFSREVLIALGIAVAKSALQAIVTFTQHYLASLGDDAG
jgi:heme/copper-type cytochrome/quinol oxidase subunit 4